MVKACAYSRYQHCPGIGGFVEVGELAVMASSFYFLGLGKAILLFVLYLYLSYS